MTSSEKKWTRLKEEITLLLSYEDATALDACHNYFDMDDAINVVLNKLDVFAGEFEDGQSLSPKRIKELIDGVGDACIGLSNQAAEYGRLQGKIEGYEYCEESINLIIKDMDLLF